MTLFEKLREKWQKPVHIIMKMSIKLVKRHERRHIQYVKRINWINYAPPVVVIKNVERKKKRCQAKNEYDSRLNLSESQPHAN